MSQDSLPLPLYSAFLLYFLTSLHFCSIKNLASRTQEGYFEILVCHLLSQPAYRIVTHSFPQHLISDSLACCSLGGARLDSVTNLTCCLCLASSIKEYQGKALAAAGTICADALKWHQWPQGLAVEAKNQQTSTSQQTQFHSISFLHSIAGSFVCSFVCPSLL